MTWQWKFLTDLKGSPGDVSLYGPAWAPTRSVPADGNLNTYRVPGLSRISTPDTATILNMPPGTRVASIFENVTTGDGTDVIIGQRLIEAGDSARTWWRSAFTDGTTFGPWSLSGTASRAVTEWHVFLAVGQSNMSGRADVTTAAGGKYIQPRIAQFGAKQAAPRVITTATVPLDMHDTASGLSPATVFANNYLRTQPDNVGVLLVPAAHGGTGFTTNTTTQTWTPGAATNPVYDLPKLAVDQTKDAITAAKAAGASVSLKGILWHQGEDNTTMSQASYTTNLDALIGYFRTQLGDANLPFIVGQMSPEGITANPGRENIDAAHKATPDRVAYTGFAAATTGGYNPGDTTHMSKAGVDFLGRTYVEALQSARINADLKPRLKAAEASLGATTSVPLSYVLVSTPPSAAAVGPTVTTLRGAPTYGAPSVDGKGALTSGVLQLVTSTEMRNAIAGNAITVEAWIRKDTNPTGTVGILGHGNFYIGMESSGKIRFRSGTTSTLLSATGVADGAFHHVAVCATVSSDRITYSNIQLWVDGVLAGTTASEPGSTGWTETWAVGGLPSAGVDFTGGIIDEIRLSRGRRYTATFAPAQRFAVDADTLSILHLDAGPDVDTGGYPARPAGAANGAVTYIGSTQPQSWAQYDRWVKV